jgi:serine/threonine protein kinase, bacterial
MAEPVAKTPNVRDHPLNLRKAFIRRTTLDHASLRGANLTEADLTNVSARCADFTDAILDRTILRGTDLTGAKITAEQLKSAITDERTILPEHLASG